VLQVTFERDKHDIHQHEREPSRAPVSWGVPAG
jgi:hypothetical protein